MKLFLCVKVEIDRTSRFIQPRQSFKEAELTTKQRAQTGRNKLRTSGNEWLPATAVLRGPVAAFFASSFEVCVVNGPCADQQIDRHEKTRN